MRRNVLVQNSQKNDGKRRECQIEKHQIRVLVQVRAIEVVKDAVPEESHHEVDVLIEKACDHFSESFVRPAPVHNQKSDKEPELANRVVARHDGLTTLLSSNADSNVSSLDHGHVVGPVTNCQSHHLQRVLDHHDNLCLLSRRHSATENRTALFAKKKKLQL
ncbi:hypothetical protein OGATHE_001410 [Ogataea polymorpha]|uniref:Uncharacterized protein n=1 Tax=Ogataea polymorpha TaxID=460523 RepID=A0A9P8PSS3_9ASCO|nr:hypothetical protein OGATHE_001410 [Ogataea polymorpha]